MFVEITMALRLAYVVIVPIFHGNVVDRRQGGRGSVAFKNQKSLSIYSILNQNLL